MRQRLIWILSICLVLSLMWACDDSDGETDGDADGDVDGDVDGDIDGDIDGDVDGDSDADSEPVGLDCTDDHDVCPSGYECACGGPGPGPWPCACGLKCEDNDDCTDPGQPNCCFGTCTDDCTCFCD